MAAKTKIKKSMGRIVITEPSIVRKVIEEQEREGSRTASGTAARIIDKYFAIRPAPLTHVVPG